MKNINVDVETREKNGLKKVILKWNFPGCGCPMEAETMWLDVHKDIQDIVQDVLIDTERKMRRNPFCSKCGQSWCSSLPEC